MQCGHEVFAFPTSTFIASNFFVSVTIASAWFPHTTTIGYFVFELGLKNTFNNLLLFNGSYVL